MVEKVIKIEKSKAKNKKYRAIVSDGKKTRIVNFGDVRYQQFKDSTPLKLYSKLDHGDKKRRENYFSRHSGVKSKSKALAKEKGGKITAKYLSHFYLW